MLNGQRRFELLLVESLAGEPARFRIFYLPLAFLDERGGGVGAVLLTSVLFPLVLLSYFAIGELVHSIPICDLVCRGQETRKVSEKPLIILEESNHFVLDLLAAAAEGQGSERQM
jgi:hypothetical protein